MKKLGLGIALVVTCFALPASADEPEPATAPPADTAQPKLRGAIILPPVVVTGRRKPVAAASIMRIEPSMTLTELRISLLSKVEKAILGPAF